MKLKFWKKKRILRPKRYGLVRFTLYARNLCVGGTTNMKICTYDGNNLIGVDDFSFKRIEQLEEIGIPVVFEESGPLPKECMVRKPEIYYVPGKLKFD